MILCFDFDLIGCKDLANDCCGEKVRHFVSQGDKTRFPSPTLHRAAKAGATLCNPIAKRKAYICSVLPRRQRFLAGRCISIAPRSAPESQLRGSLGETSAVPSRHRPAASSRSQRKPEPTPQARRTPPMKRDENTLPSTPSSGTSSALGTPVPPLRRTAERFPVRPAAFNVFHHVHSPPPFVFFRRRPLRIRTRRCPCGRTCAVFYQNRCTFFQ